MREVRTYGKNAKVYIELYDRCKYTDGAKIFMRVKYEIENWEIVTGDEATEIGNEMDCKDDYNEYLILHLVGGGTATFGNSYVDMFRIY